VISPGACSAGFISTNSSRNADATVREEEDVAEIVRS
jgi:hypothetical protein